MWEQFRDLPARMKFALVFTLSALAQITLDRLLKHLIPEGQEGPLVVRGLQWVRDVVGVIRADWLAVAALTAFALYGWDERGRWIATLRHWSQMWVGNKQGRIAMARRWIRLSDEILAEMPRSGPPPRLARLPNLSEEQRSALWQAETDQMITQFQESMDRARRLFLARITQARDEMAAEGIELGRRLDRSGGIFLVNTFCLQEWAATLGAEGRKILTEVGEEP